MSLAIYLDQIQRPTWWVFDKPKQRYERDPAITERRQKMLDMVLDSVKPLTTDEIMSATASTRQQVIVAMKEFVAAGKVRQLKPRHDFCLWVKNNG